MRRKRDLAVFQSLVFTVWMALTSPVFPADEPVVPRIQEAPVIDGNLDDPAWKEAWRATGFKTFDPDYGKSPEAVTSAMMVHDGDKIYVAFRCRDPRPASIRSSVTRRDNMFDHDFVAVVLDTFLDRQQGYGFLCNPLGVQGDGMMNAEGNLDGSADLIWESKGRLTVEGYDVEIAIPTRSLRFPNRRDLPVGVMFFRQIVRTSETASWPEVFADGGAFMGQFATLRFQGLKYHRIVEILPAFTASRIRNRVDGEFAPADSSQELGLTAKLGITPTLTLDATVNPDFSQVESDAGQIEVNLRHSAYYSEKRPFFLEGLEHFQFEGNTESAPLVSVVHTRNIIDPLYGLKLTGKFSKRDNLALIFARDRVLADDGDGEDRADFAVLRWRHVMKGDNYLGGFLTSRQAGDDWNRLAGVDGMLRLSPVTTMGFHLLGSLSRTPGSDENVDGHALAWRITRSTRKSYYFIGLQDISRDFRVDTGFLNRDGLTRLGLCGLWKWFPKSGWIQRIDAFYWGYHIYDKPSSLMESFNLVTLRLRMARSSTFRIDLIAANEVYASRRFPTGGWGFQGWTQLTRSLGLSMVFRHTGAIYYDPDEPFGGTLDRLQFDLEYKPTGNITTSLGLRYADFHRDSDGAREYDCLILRSRNTFQFNRYLFFRAIGEYNTYDRSLALDLLASFTYIPGTVVHLGYGSSFERYRWENPEYVPDNRFMQMERGFFFKVSYLWRL